MKEGKSYDLVEHIGANMPALYYVDGKRVTRSEYKSIEERGYAYGRVDCIWTKCKPLGAGRLRRTNGKVVHL